MRVLVTGSSGLVGSATAAHLMADGHEVVGLSRRLTKQNRLLSRAVAADLSRPGLADSLGATLPRCDAIVHAAAVIESEIYSPSLTLTNGLGTQQMLDLAARWEVSSFVYLSSVPVIGRPQVLPITEDHPVAPRTTYHASKLYGENLCAVACAVGTPTVSLRLSAPVGPGMPETRILPVFVRRAIVGETLLVSGTGTRAQDYVDVRDVAAAVESSLQRSPTGVLNIASGSSITNLELARRCVEVLSSSATVELSGEADPEDGVRWEVSIERAARELEYRPAHSLEDSIEALAHALRSRAPAGVDDA